MQYVYNVNSAFFKHFRPQGKHVEVSEGLSVSLYVAILLL